VTSRLYLDYQLGKSLKMCTSQLTRLLYERWKFVYDRSIIKGAVLCNTVQHCAVSHSLGSNRHNFLHIRTSHKPRTRYLRFPQNCASRHPQFDSLFARTAAQCAMLCAADSQTVLTHVLPTGWTLCGIDWSSVCVVIAARNVKPVGYTQLWREFCVWTAWMLLWGHLCDSGHSLHIAHIQCSNDILSY